MTLFHHVLVMILVLMNTMLKKKKNGKEELNGELSLERSMVLLKIKDDRDLKKRLERETRAVMHILFTMNSFLQLIKEQLPVN